MVLKILLPVDGSKRSIEAAKKGIEIAYGINAEIYALYIVPSQRMLINKVVSGDPTKLSEELNKLQASEYEKGENTLATVKNIFDEKFPRGKFIGKIIEGDPGKEIVNFAESNNIDLVIMASGKIQDRFIIGSVTEYVVRNCPCSVMVVK